MRLIMFSTGQTELRQFEFSIRRVITSVLSVVIIFVGIFMASLAVSNIAFQNESDTALEQTNLFLKKKIQRLQTDVNTLTGKLHSLEEDTEDLEVLAGLTSSDQGGTAPEDFVGKKNVIMASAPLDYDYKTDTMNEYLTSLEARIRKATSVQDKIEDRFLMRQTKIKHIPSIKPVSGARITDKFGNRKDPFIARVKHHNGIDLSARYGTRVYAAGSGVVEFTRNRYRLNKGYGKVVIINHGYGYKTLYGHLSKINVKIGQKVNRWDVIGLSGDTGRATGPHLHYEVWAHGHPQNPEDYILN